MSNELFPVFMKLQHLHTLVVGGGAVGLEKTKAILDNSPQARVTVVAPEIKKELVMLQEKYSGLHLIYAPYQMEHLKEKDLVIAATCIKELNKQVWTDAKWNKILINVADTPELCDFYLSSVVKKGNLKLGISTNGKSPTMAKRIREVLEEALPEEIDEVLNKLYEIREKLKGDFDYKVKKMNDLTSSMKSNPEDPEK